MGDSKKFVAFKTIKGDDETRHVFEVVKPAWASKVVVTVEAMPDYLIMIKSIEPIWATYHESWYRSGDVKALFEAHGVDYRAAIWELKEAGVAVADVGRLTAKRMIDGKYTRVIVVRTGA